LEVEKIEFSFDLPEKNDIIAVIGVSQDTSKWGRKVYEALKRNGYKVYPVNPKHEFIGEDKCYSSLSAIPERPTFVITVVPPKVTERVVEECEKLGIKRVWMQPGSESEKAINYCNPHGITVTHHACIVVDGLHQSFG